MQNSKCFITIHCRFNCYFKGIYIQNLRKRFSLFPHFFEYPIKMFLSSYNISNQIILFQFFLYRFFNFRQDFFPSFSRCIYSFSENGSPMRIQNFKCSIFQFSVYLMHTDSVSNGRINFNCFFRNPFLFSYGKMIQRSHVMKSICQFDNNYSDILRHC